MSAMPIVTRFAPSPTGNLHVGGARTALFNWAFARHHGGRFILRIEDTDRARSTPESTQRIIEDLRWLGIDWDEGPAMDRVDAHTAEPGDHGPYFQSQRLHIYRQYVNQLLEAGQAYKCFKTTQQLADEREKARTQKLLVTYDPTESRSLTPDKIAEYESQGKPCVIRFAVPQKTIQIQDEILGTVSLQAQQLEDFVILKSDGFPTYHLAVAVDDWLMGVTHVIRGQEHLNNAPKHAALQDALGFDRPRYAHIPLIFNPDGSKMSKRDKAKVARQAARAHDIDAPALVAVGFNDTGAFNAFMKKKNDDISVAAAIAQRLNLALPEIDVDDFRASGYLPQVLCNYIALLGWSSDDGTERFDMPFLVKHFSLARVGKSNARFDRDKLFRFNGEALAKLSSDEFTENLELHLRQFHPEFLSKFGDQFNHFAAVYHARSRTLDEPAQLGRFFVEPIQKYDTKAVNKFLAGKDGQGFETLKALRHMLDSCQDWTVSRLESVVETFAQQAGIGLGLIAQPLRIAVSGSTISPPIFDTLAILGKDSTLSRIDRCLERSDLRPQTNS